MPSSRVLLIGSRPKAQMLVLDGRLRSAVAGEQQIRGSGE